MKKLLRLTSALLCLLFLSFAGCKGVGDSPSNPGADNGGATSAPQTISLFFNEKDSLNPYAMTSEHNHKLQTLLYDPLVTLGPTFEPQFILARSIELSGKSCIVTLNTAVFSDGSELTSNDVIYSIKLAKESDGSYSDQLKSITSYTAVDKMTIEMTLSRHDPYFVNLLTFPVIKAESEKRTDQNKIVLPPVGSGRYVFNRETATLTANAYHINGVSPISVINLVDAPDAQVLDFNLESDNVDIYYSDLRDGKMPSMNGTVSAVTLNNLVYLGINMNRTWTQYPKLRYALSYAIDRTAIATKAYHSYALPTAGLFSPLFEDTKGVQNLPLSTNLQNSIANLADLGYNNKDNEGYLINSKNKRLSLSLIVNKENDRRVAAATLIKQQLEAVGISVRIELLTFKQYTHALSTGSFDLYLAEVNLPNNMDVSELVTSTGSLSFGIPEITVNETPQKKPDSSNSDADIVAPEDIIETEENYINNKSLDDAIKAFYGGQGSIVDIVNAFNAEMPIIPICYRNGITVISGTLQNSQISSVTDVYYGITNTKIK